MSLNPVRLITAEQAASWNPEYVRTYMLSSGKVRHIYHAVDHSEGMGEDRVFGYFSGVLNYADEDEANNARMKALIKLEGLKRGRRRGRSRANRARYYALMQRIAEHYLRETAIHVAHYANGPAPKRCMHG